MKKVLIILLVLLITVPAFGQYFFTKNYKSLPWAYFHWPNEVTHPTIATLDSSGFLIAKDGSNEWYQKLFDADGNVNFYLNVDGDITVPDDMWFGLGAAKGRIEFDDQATDEVNILGAIVGIGTATPGAELEVEIADTHNGIGVLIDMNETGAHVALEVDSEGGDNNIKATGKYGPLFRQDVTGGYGLYVDRNLNEAGGSPLVTFSDNSASNTQTTLYVKQVGSGDIINLFDGATEVFTVLDGGNVGIGTTTPDEVLDVNNQVTQFDSLKVHREVSNLIDDEEIVLATGVSGWGSAMLGNSEEYLIFKFTAAGAVTLLTDCSTNTANTDSDGDFCAYDAGSGIAIKNRMGGTKQVAVYVCYY